MLLDSTMLESITKSEDDNIEMLTQIWIFPSADLNSERLTVKININGTSCQKGYHIIP